MIPAQTVLDDLPAYVMSRPLPLDALARLATAAGYTARGDQVMADHHLGMALGILSRWENRREVTVAECEGLLRVIAAIAQGAPRPAATTRSITTLTCAGRVVGDHGALVRCTRPAQDGERYCTRCASIPDCVR